MMAYFLNILLSEPVWLALFARASVALPCAVLCRELGASAAYIACESRGFCWNDENACGDAGPVGKKLAMGEDGGEE